MQTLPFFGYSLYQMFIMFCFWSFIGWCVEVVDMTYETGEYQNRGFLNMPICPIHGFGVLMVVVFFRPISHTVIPLFFCSLILVTAFELFMGWGMEKLFHARWWDYSHMKFNFKGYICLRNALLFGAACVIVVRYVQPQVEKAINAIPVKIGLVFVIIMSVLIILDTIVSWMTARKLCNKIRRIDELGKKMLSVSVKTGKTLASGTLAVMNNVDKIKGVTDSTVDKIKDARDIAVDKIRDAKDSAVEKMQDLNSANIEKIRQEYERLLSEKDAATDRLLKAFPRMKSIKYSDALQAVKNKIVSKIPLFDNSEDKTQKEALGKNVPDEEKSEVEV